MGACASLSKTESPVSSPASEKRGTFLPTICEEGEPTHHHRLPTEVRQDALHLKISLKDIRTKEGQLCSAPPGSKCYRPLISQDCYLPLTLQDTETGEINELLANRFSIWSDCSDTTISELTNPRNSLALLEERIALRSELFKLERNRQRPRDTRTWVSMDTMEVAMNPALGSMPIPVNSEPGYNDVIPCVAEKISNEPKPELPIDSLYSMADAQLMPDSYINDSILTENCQALARPCTQAYATGKPEGQGIPICSDTVIDSSNDTKGNHSQDGSKRDDGRAETSPPATDHMQSEVGAVTNGNTVTGSTGVTYDQPKSELIEVSNGEPASQMTGVTNDLPESIATEVANNLPESEAITGTNTLSESEATQVTHILPETEATEVTHMLPTSEVTEVTDSPPESEVIEVTHIQPESEATTGTNRLSETGETKVAYIPAESESTEATNSLPESGATEVIHILPETEATKLTDSLSASEAINIRNGLPESEATKVTNILLESAVTELTNISHESEAIVETNRLPASKVATVIDIITESKEIEVSESLAMHEVTELPSSLALPEVNGVVNSIPELEVTQVANTPLECDATDVTNRLPASGMPEVPNALPESQSTEVEHIIPALELGNVKNYQPQSETKVTNSLSESEMVEISHVTTESSTTEMTDGTTQLVISKNPSQPTSDEAEDEMDESIHTPNTALGYPVVDFTTNHFDNTCHATNNDDEMTSNNLPDVEKDIASDKYEANEEEVISAPENKARHILDLGKELIEEGNRLKEELARLKEQQNKLQEVKKEKSTEAIRPGSDTQPEVTNGDTESKYNCETYRNIIQQGRRLCDELDNLGIKKNVSKITDMKAQDPVPTEMQVSPASNVNNTYPTFVSEPLIGLRNCAGQSHAGLQNSPPRDSAHTHASEISEKGILSDDTTDQPSQDAIPALSDAPDACEQHNTTPDTTNVLDLSEPHSLSSSTAELSESCSEKSADVTGGITDANKTQTLQSQSPAIPENSGLSESFFQISPANEVVASGLDDAEEDAGSDSDALLEEYNMVTMDDVEEAETAEDCRDIVDKPLETEKQVTQYQQVKEHGETTIGHISQEYGVQMAGVYKEESGADNRENSDACLTTDVEDASYKEDTREKMNNVTTAIGSLNKTMQAWEELKAELKLKGTNTKDKCSEPSHGEDAEVETLDKSTTEDTQEMDFIDKHFEDKQPHNGITPAESFESYTDHASSGNGKKAVGTAATICSNKDSCHGNHTYPPGSGLLDQRGANHKAMKETTSDTNSSNESSEETTLGRLSSGNKCKIFNLTMKLQREMGRMQLEMSNLQTQMRQTTAALQELSSLVIDEMEIQT